MKPENNRSLNERMEQASLDDIMPDFNSEAEWMQLSYKLHPLKTKKMQMPWWAYAAAVLLLISLTLAIKLALDKPSESNLAKQHSIQHDTSTSAAKEWAKRTHLTPMQQKESLAAYDNGPYFPPEMIDSEGASIRKIVSRIPPMHLQPRAKKYQKTNITITPTDKILANYNTKEFVCNGTPCPLQICILQTLQCPLKPPSTVASCSTLEPDESGQLKYKVNKKAKSECTVTIDEIRITRITTGETIVLNSDSKPTTAQDVFNYISGEKAGDLLTGIFHSDCDNNNSNQSLKIDNSYGNIIIE